MDGESKIGDRATLIAARRQLLSVDDGWNDYSDNDAHDAFAKLDAIQCALLATDFSGDDGLMIALELLLEGDDHPNFTDEFKNRLFHILRKNWIEASATRMRRPI